MEINNFHALRLQIYFKHDHKKGNLMWYFRFWNQTISLLSCFKTVCVHACRRSSTL